MEILAEPFHGISIHPPRVGRDCRDCWRTFRTKISIHPPRVGRDLVDAGSNAFNELISIHPPRVGRDQRDPGIGRGRQDFNPPSPCGEGLSRTGAHGRLE